MDTLINNGMLQKAEVKGVRTPQALRLLPITCLLFIAGIILKPFWSSVVWAGIITIIFWPPYHLLKSRWPRFPNLSAGVFTFLLITCLITPIAWGINELQKELPTLSVITAHLDLEKLVIPSWFKEVPVLGNSLERVIASVQSEPSNRSEFLQSLIGPLLAKISTAVQHVPQNIAALLLTVICLFFFLRDGLALGHHIGDVLTRLTGVQARMFLNNIQSTTRAVAYGLFGSALVQGIIGSIGFWIFGFEMPLLLGLLTAISSVIPVFGTILIWGPSALWSIIQGDISSGVGLFVWGALVINPADNVLRPIMISENAHHPLLLIILGVMGGLFSLGPIGIFIGPLCLTTLSIASKEWVKKA